MSGRLTSPECGPTPKAELYAWHTNALKGHLAEDWPITEEPHVGWFKRRLVKHGPFVPCKIWMFQPTDDDGELIGDEKLQCEVNGQFADPEDQWPWLCQNPISEADFNYLTASLAWAAENAPGEPMANVRKAVDWTKTPTPTFTKEQDHE